MWVRWNTQHRKTGLRGYAYGRLSFVATAACLAVSVSCAARAAGPRLARLGEQSVSEYYRIANSTRVPTWAAAWGRVRVCKSSPHQYLIILEIHMYLATRLHYRRQEAGSRGLGK